MKEIFKSLPGQFTFSVALIALTALVCSPLANTPNYHVVSYILLFVVSILSALLRVGPMLVASALSALVWNFFFIPPHLTFHIEKTEDILIFCLFFIIALINGILTTRIKRQEQIAREREKRTHALFLLTKELSKASGIEEVLKTSIEEIKIQFGIDPLFVLQDGNNHLHVSGRLQKEKKLTPAEYSAAEWSFQHRQTAGAFTSNTFGVDCTFYPLKGTRLHPGVLVVRLRQNLKDDQNSYWDLFVTQISNALEREFLGELAQKVRFLDESDRLYKTLFNSISHELRIPVATIMGASDSIIHSVNTENEQKALSYEIFTASQRLNRLIENLLNMSRLESGHLSVRLDWYDINDLINKVTDDLKDDLKPFTLHTSVHEDIQLVKIDFGLMEQVLYNLLFNSTQYAPAASTLDLSVTYSNGKIVITVSDKGSGFPEAELKNVFRKFFRIDSSKPGGLGIGLSIVKGFVEAHKGTIQVENLEEGGAMFTIEIPSDLPDINDIKNN